MGIIKGISIKETNPTLGFNLKEVMVVMFILGMISIFAISKYNSYYNNAILTASMNCANNIKEKIMLFYLNADTFPESDSIPNLYDSLDDNSKKYISEVRYIKGNDGLPTDVIDQVQANILGSIQLDLIKPPVNNKNNVTRLYYVASVAEQTIDSSSTTSTAPSSAEVLSSEQIKWIFILQGEAESAENIQNINYINYNGPSSCAGNTYWFGDSCVSCTAGAECSRGFVTKCPTGYYGNTCSYTASSCDGYIIGSGYQSSCTTCPSHTICTNGAITDCQAGYYGDNCESECSGTLSGNWPNKVCMPCPSHTICTNGAISGCISGYVNYQGSCIADPCSSSTVICSNGSMTGCQAGYYGNNCQSVCSSGLLSGEWPNKTCAPCPNNTICANGIVTGCTSGYYYYQGTCVASCPNNSMPLNVNCQIANDYSKYSNSLWIFGWYKKCQQYSNLLSNNTPICDPCHTSEHYSNPSWYFCGCIMPFWEGMPNAYVSWITGQNTDCSSFCSSKGGFAMVGPFC